MPDTTSAHIPGNNSFPFPFVRQTGGWHEGSRILYGLEEGHVLRFVEEYLSKARLLTAGSALSAFIYYLENLLTVNYFSSLHEIVIARMLRWNQHFAIQHGSKSFWMLCCVARVAATG